MAFSGFDHRLLAEFRRRDVSWSQTYLLQRILRAISKTSLFSQHVAGLAGMSAELPRAQAVLRSFADTGQPGRALVRAHCEAAAYAVARWGVDDLRQSLVDAAAMIAVQSNPLDELKTLALSTAAEIDAQLPKIHDLLDNALAEAWNSAGDLELVADEFACLVATADRDPAALTQDLIRAFRTMDKVDAPALKDLLLPRASAYRVAVVVHGAAELTRLDALHEAAVCSAVREPERLGFGAALGRLRRFTQQASTNGAACLVACQVNAVDAPSAGRVARRELAELLDQYMAGHRLVALSLGDDVFVSRVDSGESRHIQSHTPTVHRAVPLVSHWPGTLRNGLRMAHVARATEAPLPAAALAWAALEACGLNKRDDIAAVLALQAMRQQIVEAHQQLRQGARTFPAELRLVDSHATTNDFNRLHDLNTWVDLLLPKRASEAPVVTVAREALASVVSQMSPLAGQQVHDWSDRLTNPVACAQWLADRHQRIATFLHALNATRNMSLHTGQFRAFGDVTLGIGGSLVVDFTLEILGNWYRNAEQESSPAKVIALLAGRQRDLVERLRTHDGPLFDLNVAWLTSPTSDGIWTRSDG
ncbi:hypothetical protein DMH04_01410 [Kibdelosporangium aridum]|uniref:Uncharacterized protein n=1 Tax=Kibdelosporangium aridum TaxID=2030 RepID=A0A428ZU99_KIBAR|nr:hypothetical protein [Kibdelosporangium aridum]RSM91664.1 hypothetical protein DMH04_01410 [Kibdelosporangium aridum]